MAQTKRKRRTKHRGTAAGTIQTRGRTGRPPSADERKKQDRVTSRERRLNTPPTWKSSFTRAGMAAALMFIFVLLTTKGSNKATNAVLFAAIAMAIYVPAGYYFDVFLFKRRQKRKELAK
jgi:hypothetical protein